MKDIYNEAEIEKIAQAVINKVRDKVVEEIVETTHLEMSSYLYEHYQNNKDKIEGELIRSITEEYVKKPTEYKFKALREKMFLENKEELVKTLTDEAIQQSVENVIENYTHRNYHFSWRWNDGIAKFILDNWSKFEADERVQSFFGRKKEQYEQRIKYLEQKLADISGISED